MLAPQDEVEYIQSTDLSVFIAKETATNLILRRCEDLSDQPRSIQNFKR